VQVYAKFASLGTQASQISGNIIRTLQPSNSDEVQDIIMQKYHTDSLEF
jgi:hypothetical protein